MPEFILNGPASSRTTTAGRPSEPDDRYGGGEGETLLHIVSILAINVVRVARILQIVRPRHRYSRRPVRSHPERTLRTAVAIVSRAGPKKTTVTTERSAPPTPTTFTGRFRAIPTAPRKFRYFFTIGRRDKYCTIGFRASSDGRRLARVCVRVGGRGGNSGMETAVI